MIDYLALPALAFTVVAFIFYVVMVWLTPRGRALGRAFFEDDEDDEL